MTSPWTAQRRFLYVIRGGPALCKIGFSANPARRLDSALWVRQGNRLAKIHAPEKLTIVFKLKLSPHCGRAAEKCLKHVLQNKRHAGEWFDISAALAVEQIEKIRKALPRCGESQVYDFIRNTTPL